MLVLGLILVLVATGALVAALVGGSNDPAQFDLGLFDVQTNTLGVFLIGAATVLLLVLGLELIRAGLRRASRRRQERKQLKRLEAREAETRHVEPAPTATHPTAATTTTTTEAPAGTHAAPVTPPETAPTTSTDTPPTTETYRRDTPDAPR